MKLTVATYNILHGQAAGYDWNVLAYPILSCGADVVGLQEVDMGTRRVGGRNTLDALSGATGLPYAVFIPTMDFNGGQYGTAILSRFPLDSLTIHPLTATGLEPRTCGSCRVLLPGRDPLLFLNTHLSYEDRRTRRIQLSELAGLIPGEEPFFLTGDFNTEALSEFEALIEVGGQPVNQAPALKTFRNPPLAIDNILYHPDRTTFLARGMVETDASDHNLLWADFEA